MFILTGRPGYWYRVIEPLGEGGAANVYRCARVGYRGPLLVVQYAVKVLREARDGENLQRFKDEALVLGRLRHPNLIPAIEIHLEHDPPYYVMPVMKETLAKHLANMKRRGELYRAQYALQNFLLPVCRAVLHLHSSGVVHRDIKPANIFLDSAGTPKLGDLSICHVPRPLLRELTWCGLGSQGYTAPETLATGVATPQSDIYSLGIVGYEMLTGNHPAPYWWLCSENLPSAQHPRSCHRYVDSLLIGMTHPKPDSRYKNVTQVIKDIVLLTKVHLPTLPAYSPAPPPVFAPPVRLRKPEPQLGSLASLLPPPPPMPAFPRGSLAALLPPPPSKPSYRPDSFADLIARLAPPLLVALAFLALVSRPI